MITRVAIIALALSGIVAFGFAQDDDCPIIDEVTTSQYSLGGHLSGPWKVMNEKDCSGEPSSMSWNYSIEKCYGYAFKGEGKIPIKSIEVTLGISWDAKHCQTFGASQTTNVPACKSARANARQVRIVDCISISYRYQYPEWHTNYYICVSGEYTDTIVRYTNDYMEGQDQFRPCKSDGSPCCPTPTPTPCYDKNGEIPCPPTPTPTPCYDKDGEIPCPPTPTPPPCDWDNNPLPGASLPVAWCGDPPPATGP